MSKIFLTLLFLIQTLALAEAAPETESPVVPSPSPSPSASVTAPTRVGTKIPDYPFKCDRLILYRGKSLPCDSPLARDGEYLRPYFADVPGALEELDTYQRNRKKVRFAAYTGTVGLALALTAPLTKSLFVPSGNERDRDRDRAESTIRYSGFGITIGSVLFGLSSLRSNEDHLKLAVVRYNQAHPGKPIELLFHSEF